MFSLNTLKSVSATAVVAFTALATPVCAGEMVQRLGPVPAHEPILKTVGNKNVLAFFEPGNGQCNLQAVIWKVDDIETNPTRVRVGLYPGQSASIDSSATASFTLRCGDNADRLAIVDDKAFVAAGAGN
jgi:hypothetical protein